MRRLGLLLLSAMKNDATALERAFQIAQSGQVAGIQELKSALRRKTRPQANCGAGAFDAAPGAIKTAREVKQCPEALRASAAPPA
jgi:hypothetical protein